MGLKTILLASTFISTSFSSAFAGQAAASRYDDLLSYFKTGTLPKVSEIQGVWTGRCFTNTAPNAAYGMLLFAENVATQPGGDSNGGPLFPKPVTTFNISTANRNGINEPADAFDNVAPTDDVIATFTTSDSFRSLVSTEDSGSLQASDGGAKYLYRKYQNYFLAEAIATADSDQMKKGTVAWVCYFFKRIHD